jgi:hypothetical protein
MYDLLYRAINSFVFNAYVSIDSQVSFLLVSMH